jgi:long-chain fatty acid transport protein
MSSRIAVVAAFAAGLTLPAASVSAQGFGIYEQGTCVMARAGAGVAQPCADGSAIYINPAGLIAPKGWVITGGATLIHGTGTFTADQGPVTSSEVAKGAPPPHLYLVDNINDKVAVGFGTYVPYGLRIQWPLDFGGRFISYDSSLTTVYLQPTIAYAVTPSISIGAGLTIARGSVELNRREDLANVPLGTTGLTFGALVDSQTDFENTVLSASGAWGAGANFGAIVKANEQLRFGVRYLTHIKLHYSGSATFTPIAGSFRVTKPNPLGFPVGTPLNTLVAVAQSALQSQPASTDIDMPAQLVVGTSVSATDRLTVFADYQWVQWSAFDAVVLNFSTGVPPNEVLPQNFRNTNAIRLGLQYNISPIWRVTGGYFHNQAAAPDENVTPLLPDAARNHFTAGVGWTPHPKLTVDVAYQFVAYDDRRGRIVNPSPGTLPTTALNSGVYRSRGDLVGITLTFRP